MSHLPYKEQLVKASRKVRGRETERILAQYLRDHGWEHAHQVGSGASGSDIQGIEGLDIEVKARSKFDPKSAMAQLKARKATGLGVAVLRLNGQGEAAIDDWVAVIRVEDLVYLLKANGY
jgi:hypothetical protein